jgi:2-C-methyl-D-erythritol 4-phosphate cytidylyltransferase
LLERAYRSGRARARWTDDAGAVESIGGKVRLAEGDRWNLKVTTRQDLAIADRILRFGLKSRP